MGSELRLLEESIERFNEWMMGDMEAVVEEVDGDRAVILVTQGCGCSLDFSVREELEGAFRDSGLRASIESIDWDAERGGYRVVVRLGV